MPQDCRRRTLAIEISWQRYWVTSHVSLTRVERARGVRTLHGSSAKGATMRLTFPNQSRSFGDTRDAGRFWCDYSAIECSFFVTRAALERLVPSLSSGKSDLLAAFD